MVQAFTRAPVSKWELETGGKFVMFDGLISGEFQQLVSPIGPTFPVPSQLALLGSQSPPMAEDSYILHESCEKFEIHKVTSTQEWCFHGIIHVGNAELKTPKQYE